MLYRQCYVIQYSYFKVSYKYLNQGITLQLVEAYKK
jgi:hypothetical protein